jgi:hypothetical protein
LQALDKRQALLCILSENCDEPMYKKLVTALCMEHGIPLLKVSSVPEMLYVSLFFSSLTEISNNYLDFLYQTSLILISPDPQHACITFVTQCVASDLCFCI